MYRLVTHVVVSFLAFFLAFSAAYVFSERDEFTTLFYGSSSRLIIPPNTNTTVPLARVSDRHEIGSLTVHLSTWTAGEQSSSIQRPTSYSLETSLSVTVQVNKSAFMFLEEVNFTSFELNRTVDATAFHSSNFPLDEPQYKEESTIQSGIELNKFYQLKIGNYETFLINQTGPLRFTIQRTNRSLEVVVGTTGHWAPPRYSVTITFTRKPNLYLVAILLIVDAALITTYSVMYKKRIPERKTSNSA